LRFQRGAHVDAALDGLGLIRTRRGEGAIKLGKCDSEQARAKQDKTGNGHSEETVRSEFFTHGTPPPARESDCDARKADVGPQSADTIKLNFIKELV
jgi:hypothetical protein